MYNYQQYSLLFAGVAMGHGKEAAYRIPPASEFCSIKGIPQLEDLEAALHKKGLKDPWIRYVLYENFIAFVQSKALFLKEQAMYFMGILQLADSM